MTQRKHTPSYTAEFRARGVRLFSKDRRLAGLNIDDNSLCAPLSAYCFAIACRAMDTLNQAICQRSPEKGGGLIHHSDRGSRRIQPVVATSH